MPQFHTAMLRRTSWLNVLSLENTVGGDKSLAFVKHPLPPAAARWSLSVLMQGATAAQGRWGGIKIDKAWSSSLGASESRLQSDYESLDVVCVIKGKEVVWKYKGERSEGKGRRQRK